MPEHRMVITHYMGRSQEMEIEGTKLNGMDSPRDLLDKPSRVSNNLAFLFRQSKITPVGPEKPMRGLADDLCSLAQHGKLASDRVAHPSVKDPEWWETQEWGNKGGFPDELGQVGPCSSC